MAFDSIFCNLNTAGIIEIPLRSSTDGSLKTGVLYSAVTIKIHDQSNSVLSVTPVSMTAGTYTSSGWVETSDSGIYQFGIPDYVFSGHQEVSIHVSASGALDCVRKIILFDADLRSATAGLLNVSDVRSNGQTLLVTGSAANGGTSTSVVTQSFSCTVGVANQFVGRILVFDLSTISPELAGLACLITASTNSATPTLTVSLLDGSPLPHAPSKDDTFVIT